MWCPVHYANLCDITRMIQKRVQKSYTPCSACSVFIISVQLEMLERFVRFFRKVLNFNYGFTSTEAKTLAQDES